MATYTLISSNVLTSSAASVTFSSIPATYTDLVLRASIRGTAASTFAGAYISINNDSSALYSLTRLRGSGAAASSAGLSNDFPGFDTQGFAWPAANATANTFGSLELYIPNYANSTNNKCMSINYVSETNATTAYIYSVAFLYSATTAITSIQLGGVGGGVLDAATGSSFYLYGISNA
jgi:hypothetical protein